MFHSAIVSEIVFHVLQLIPYGHVVAAMTPTECHYRHEERGKEDFQWLRHCTSIAGWAEDRGDGLQPLVGE